MRLLRWEIGLFQPVDASSALAGIQDEEFSYRIIGKQDRCGGGTPFALVSWHPSRRPLKRSVVRRRDLPSGRPGFTAWETRLDSFQRALDQV
jgi:hypothetical protein